MPITSAPYFAFLLLVFFGYWLIANRYGWRVVFLAIASCFFYSQAGVVAILLLLAVSAIDFTTSRLMARSSAPARSSGSLRKDTFRRALSLFPDPERHRKTLLLISLATDTGILGVFKYANFFLDSAGSILSTAGLPAPTPRLKLLAPIGVSFFIFQSMAYVIDVYRKDAEPAESYLEYLSFISFFPTIIAGPIVRAKQLLPQLKARVSIDPQTGGQALFLIAIGLLKKIAIADYLSANLVDRVFDFPERFSSAEVLTAVYGYAIQIYADFSGYSDIAIGSALLLGITLPVNFNSPYRSSNLPEFWRRWHISLSTWLRDYVFFPVAGKRLRNRAMLYAGLVITMLVGGLWHGASWTFVVWGGLHGAGLVAARFFESVKPVILRYKSRFAWTARNKSAKPGGRKFWSRAIAVVFTFHFVCLTWIFFRAETIGQAAAVLKQIFSLTFEAGNLTLPVVIVISIGFIAHWTPNRIWDAARDGFIRLPSPIQAFLLVSLGLGLYLIASSDVAPFIYTRF